MKYLSEEYDEYTIEAVNELGDSFWYFLSYFISCVRVT